MKIAMRRGEKRRVFEGARRMFKQAAARIIANIRMRRRWRRSSRRRGAAAGRLVEACARTARKSFDHRPCRGRCRRRCRARSCRCRAGRRLRRAAARGRRERPPHKRRRPQLERIGRRGHLAPTVCKRRLRLSAVFQRSDRKSLVGTRVQGRSISRLVESRSPSPTFRPIVSRSLHHETRRRRRRRRRGGRRSRLSARRQPTDLQRPHRRARRMRALEFYFQLIVFCRVKSGIEKRGKVFAKYIGES